MRRSHTYPSGFCHHVSHLIAQNQLHVSTLLQWSWEVWSSVCSGGKEDWICIGTSDVCYGPEIRSEFSSGKKKKKKAGRKEVGRIHRREPQKDGWETKERPKGKIELLFCWDLQCELGAKNSLVLAWIWICLLHDGRGQALSAGRSFSTVSSRQQSALTSMASLTKLRFPGFFLRFA